MLDRGLLTHHTRGNGPSTTKSGVHVRRSTAVVCPPPPHSTSSACSERAGVWWCGAVVFESTPLTHRWLHLAEPPSHFCQGTAQQGQRSITAFIITRQPTPFSDGDGSHCSRVQSGSSNSCRPSGAADRRAPVLLLAHSIVWIRAERCTL